MRNQSVMRKGKSHTTLGKWEVIKLNPRIEVVAAFFFFVLRALYWHKGTILEGYFFIYIYRYIMKVTLRAQQVTEVVRQEKFGIIYHIAFSLALHIIILNILCTSYPFLFTLVPNHSILDLMNQVFISSTFFFLHSTLSSVFA